MDRDKKRECRTQNGVYRRRIKQGVIKRVCGYFFPLSPSDKKKSQHADSGDFPLIPVLLEAGPPGSETKNSLILG